MYCTHLTPYKNDSELLKVGKQSSQIFYLLLSANFSTNPVVKLPVFYLCLVQNRGRLAEKRTIPLPPNRVPKKELSSIFSSDDSEGSERASGDHAHIKQEEELPYSIMRKR